MIKTYSLTKDGNTSLSAHFKVREFDREGDVVEVDTELIEKLELLSDCLNNAPVYINSTHNAFSVNIYVKGYTAKQLAVICEICDFKGISVLNNSTVCVNVKDCDKPHNFIRDCEWIKILRFKKNLVKGISFPEIRDTIKNFAKRFNDKGTHVSNGGFYCTYKCAQFNYKTNGVFVTSYPDHKYGMGVKLNGELHYGNVATEDYIEFLSGHPILTDNHRQCDFSYAKEIDGNHPRKALGYDNNYVYKITVDGRSKKAKGLTLFALRQLMTHYNIAYSINLDGGGSTADAEDGVIINVPSENRLVNNAVMIKYLGEAEEI